MKARTRRGNNANTMQWFAMAAAGKIAVLTRGSDSATPESELTSALAWTCLQGTPKQRHGSVDCAVPRARTRFWTKFSSVHLLRTMDEGG